MTDAKPMLVEGLPNRDTDWSVSELQHMLATRLACVLRSELCPLAEALGRVLAADITSPMHVPPHNNSAMDGYAFRHASGDEQGNITRLVCGTALAGKPWAGAVEPTQCIRIMTGAVIPAGCDTVIPQEKTNRAGDMVSFAAQSVRQGENVREAGEDLRTGEVALPAGRILKPADLGLLASLGIADVAVYQPLRVAYLTSGDELRAPGQPLDEGSIYDSNRYTLMGMLKRLGFVEPIEIPPVRDDANALEAALTSAALQADVIVASGGVSVGEADHTRTVLQRMGKIVFCSVAMRPGRPFAIGMIEKDERFVPLFGLPGNPVATMVAFYAFVRDALVRLAGAQPEPLLTVSALLTETVKKRPGRTEYQRVVLQRGPNGQWQARLTGQQGSGMLRSMSQANALMVLAEDQETVSAGSTVEVIPFEGLM